MKNEYKTEIVLKKREIAEVVGILGVLSFDDKEVKVDTADGRLSIFGEGLMVVELLKTESRLTISGVIDGFEFASMKRGLWKK